MRKTFLIFLICFNSNYLCAQFWVTPGATWHYSFDQMLSYGYVKIEKIGDTLINSINCDVLQKTQFGYTSPGNYDTINLGREFIYLDSNIVRVYRNNNFWTLYDFNAVIGTTWTCAGNNSSCPQIGEFIVDSIGYLFLNGDSLKVLYTKPHNNSQWTYTAEIVEKIGCISYMFPQPRCISDALEGGLLRCYNDSSGWMYISGISQTCEYINHIPIINNLLIYDIYPNPAVDYFILKFNDFINNKKKTINIYDTNGNIVEKLETYNNDLVYSTINLKAGFYEISLQFGNEIVIYKHLLIINH